MRRFGMIGCALAMLVATPAQADVIEWDGSESSDWSNDDNWVGGTAPGSGDRAVIPNSAQNINTIVDTGFPTTQVKIDSIEIESDASVTIASTMTLTIENDDTNCGIGHPNHTCPQYDHRIDGTLQIGDGDTGDSTLEFVNDSVHTVAGDGEIKGSGTNDELWIETDVVVESHLDDAAGGITDSLTIQGEIGTGGADNGTLDNRGRVATDSLNATIILGADLALDDTAGAVWESSACGNVHFYRSAALEGDFRHMHQANFHFAEESGSTDVVVTTCGTYYRQYVTNPQAGCHQGFQFYTANSAFQYQYFDTITSDNSCPNPADYVPSSPTCSDPYEVNQSKTKQVCE